MICVTLFCLSTCGGRRRASGSLSLRLQLRAGTGSTCRPDARPDARPDGDRPAQELLQPWHWHDGSGLMICLYRPGQPGLARQNWLDELVTDDSSVAWSYTIVMHGNLETLCELMTSIPSSMTVEQPQDHKLELSLHFCTRFLQRFLQSLPWCLPLQPFP